MAEIGPFGFQALGGDSCLGILQNLLAQGAGYTYAMPALNNAICFRFTATTTKDIKSVKVSWYQVSTPGNVDVRIETIDATTGKPTGSLYDANAAVTASPSTSSTWQTFTFATLPTTGLTVGTEYGIVIITSTAGTTHTLRSHSTVSALPVVTLTATDGSTRSNFAEVNNTIPICTLVLDDDTEESCGMSPFATCNTAFSIYGADRWCGSVITIPTGIQFTARGVAIGYVYSGGTATSRGNLRVRILNATNGEEVSRTIDRDSLLNLSTRHLEIVFDPVTLAAGVHRIILDSSASTVTDYWSLRAGVASSSKFVPSYSHWTSCTDASTGPTWSDDTTAMGTVQLLFDDLTSTGGTTEGFTGTLINRGIN